MTSLCIVVDLFDFLSLINNFGAGQKELDVCGVIAGRRQQ